MLECPELDFNAVDFVTVVNEAIRGGTVRAALGETRAAWHC